MIVLRESTLSQNVNNIVAMMVMTFPNQGGCRLGEMGFYLSNVANLQPMSAQKPPMGFLWPILTWSGWCTPETTAWQSVTMWAIVP